MDTDTTVWYDCGSVGTISSKRLDVIHVVVGETGKPYVKLYEWTLNKGLYKDRIAVSDELLRSLQEYREKEDNFVVLTSPGDGFVWIRECIIKSIVSFERGPIRHTVDLFLNLKGEKGRRHTTLRLLTGLARELEQHVLSRVCLPLPEGCMAMVTLPSSKKRLLFASGSRPQLSPGSVAIPEDWLEWHFHHCHFALSPAFMASIHYVSCSRRGQFIIQTKEQRYKFPTGDPALNAGLVGDFFNSDSPGFLLGVPQEKLVCINLWRCEDGSYHAEVQGRGTDGSNISLLRLLSWAEVKDTVAKLCAGSWAQSFRNLAIRGRLLVLRKGSTFDTIYERYSIEAKKNKLLFVPLPGIRLKMGSLVEIDQLVTLLRRCDDHNRFYVKRMLK